MDAIVADNIDISPVDRSVTSDNEKLSGATAIVHTTNRKALRGKLRLLSYARRNLLIDLDDGPKLIAFSKVCYVSFTQKLGLRAEKHSYAGLHILEGNKSNDQVYKVTLSSGEIVNGKYRAFSIDEGGIHIHKLFDSQHVIRLFIPEESVSSYQIGDLMGGALVKSRKASQKAIDHAAALQQQRRSKMLGDYLLDAGVISQAQLEHALSIQKGEKSGIDSAIEGRRLGEILVAEGAITQAQLDTFLGQQDTARRKKIGEYLEEMGFSASKDVQVELAKKTGLPFVMLDQNLIEEQALAQVPREICEKYNFVPIKLEMGKLMVAIEDPLNKEAIQTLRFITNLPVELVVAPANEISEAIKKCYGDLLMRQDIVDAENLQEVLNFDNEQTEKLKQLGDSSANAPIVRLVARFILDAIRTKSSDIHLRPKRDEVQLLFRIDGELVKIRNFKKSLLNPIISRIKIIGKMDIAERRLPQDGSAQIVEGESEVDLRISVIPTVEGESAVIRLLNAKQGLKSISELGFNQRDAEIFTDMMHKSFGLVLVTGPTGSGKSTTLYAALQEVIQRNLNIITVENPVEYHIQGIEQIQVNTVPGYTFAKALRHILRHDPDVIMIGEIRDEETCKIAVESALTGHLVLSTLHTNDAAGAITRLLEMGVDPFLLTGTILGVFAQRLVRRNCTNCLAEEKPKLAIVKALGVGDSEKFFKGAGCELCRGTGYSGRIAAYELLQFNNDMKKILHSTISTQEVHEQAVKGGMLPLTENALELARRKITSLEEVYRVRLE